MRLTPYCGRSQVWRPKLYWMRYKHGTGIELNVLSFYVGVVVGS